MSEALCISVTFLDPRFHGRGDGGVPEWPPSPMRLFQAMVAGNGPIPGTGSSIEVALRWLETQPPPTVFAPPSRNGTPCPLYVPNNAMDLVAKAWGRGNIEASIAEHRTLKTVRPTHLHGADSVHYLWPIISDDSASPPVKPLARAVECMFALGWGIDLVVAQCRVLSSCDSIGEGLERWDVTRADATTTLRCPMSGSLDALVDRYAAFQNRLADETFHPVPPFTAYRTVGYRRPADPVGQPSITFELRNTDGSRCRYPHGKLIHIAGMVRHLAIRAMASKALLEKLYPGHDQSKNPFHDGSPPSGIENPDNWIETYIAGHVVDGSQDHRQLSYLPLPSVGHQHTDPGVRRVMIAAPVGDDAWLDHVARRLAGQTLKPEPGKPDPFAGREPPLLVPIKGDNVSLCYTRPTHTWYSFTPVVLPGHDDHKPEKTRRLIQKALAQSGIDQPCEFEWSAFSRFSKSLSAHKYDRNGRPSGYIRPDHLLTQTAVHLTLRFKNNVRVPGPLAIGAGRHCGLGLFAAGGFS